MKILVALFIIFSCRAWGGEEPGADSQKGPKKFKLEKTPKSIFLIKRAKIKADVGGPQYYPAEAQLRTIIDDPALHNINRFE